MASSNSVPYLNAIILRVITLVLSITNNGKPVLGDLTINHIWARGENTIINNIDANNHNNSVYCDVYPNASFIIMAENNNCNEQCANCLNDK